jgi:hypothetical protein
MITASLDQGLAPPITEPVLCEYFCFDSDASGWILLIGVPLGVAGAVWLTGRGVGQRGNFWLTVLGILIGFGVIIAAAMLQEWLLQPLLPPIWDIVVPVLFGPFMASLLYQLSARDVRIGESIEVES